ncbi:MAG TPA: hypothetical protein VJ851_10955 [Jatrophihabitans sp.]|nr:hypothetical protein [Jatrophihabitans sp.]
MGCRLSLLDVAIEVGGDPSTGQAVLDELGSFVAMARLAGATADAEVGTIELEVSAGTAAGQLLAELTRIAVDHSPRLCIHAGVVSAAGASIVVPGASGLGKSTLTAALVQAGFGYLSDEVLAVPRTGGLPAPFARPLALTADSWTALGLDPTERPAAGDERLIAPERLGSLGVPAPVRQVLLAERRPGPAELTMVSRGAAVSALLSRSFNHFRDPAGSFRAVVDLLQQAQVWTAGYQEAPELAALLAGRWLNDGR